MNLQLDIDFTTPSPLDSADGRALWVLATRFSKTLGQRNTYAITLTTVTENHVEDVIGDAMNEIRRALPSLNPNAVRMVGVRVTRIGVEAHHV